MDKKVKSKSGKKRYSKPQITRVKLAVKEVILGTCWGDNTANATLSTCNTPMVCPLP